jgi:Tubulin domain/Misato Segment II tubulin-like domain
VTYTPRLLLVDLKGTLTHMPDDGGLYSDTNYYQNLPSGSQNTDDDPEAAYLQSLKNTVEWDQSRVEVIKQPVAPKPEFQVDLDKPDTEMTAGDYNLKETVRNWPDFLYTRYHPRSINVLQHYEHSEVESQLDTFTNGGEVWRNQYFDDGFCDKIRAYIEECERCQGFQNFFDCTDGFSGIAAKCLEHLADEYGKPVFSAPLIAPKVLLFKNSDAPMTDSIRLVNIAMSLVHLNEYSALFTPLSTMQRGWRAVDQPRKFGGVSYDAHNLYQTSAILATYLDSISTKYRLKDGCGGDLGGLCNDMNGYGRRMAAAGLALPFAMKASEDLIDCLDRTDQPLFTPLTPNTTIGTDRVVQSMCVRGLPSRRLKRPRSEASQKQMQMAAYRCDSISEMFQLYYQCNYYASMTHVTAIEDSTKVKLPYPQEIFNDGLTCDGFIDDQSQRVEGTSKF